MAMFISSYEAVLWPLNIGLSMRWIDTLKL